MYYEDHVPPHFHASYGEIEARVLIASGDVLYGTCLGGLVGEVDLTEKLRGNVGPVFELLRDETFYSLVTIDEELGTVVCPMARTSRPTFSTTKR